MITLFAKRTTAGSIAETAAFFEKDISTISSLARRIEAKCKIDEGLANEVSCLERSISSTCNLQA